MNEAKNQRICENCKYHDYGLFDYHCCDCIIETNDKWESNETA